ncbi:hypothetical protein SO802_011229 [Lithocarpus litseifolius]|uniref:Uncharacterized protein n=1 Tax=Lithocarpus litseifolius TaxID=425828 RepID=A0AAW2D1V7_9ROSI
MKYPKSKNPKPFFFLLNSTTHKTLVFYLGTFTGCMCLVEITSFWSHTEGKKIPLKITSKVFIKGSIYEIEMHVEIVAKKAYSRSLTYMNNFTAKQGNGDFDMASLESTTSATDEKHEVGLFQRIFRCFTKENGSLKVTEVNGVDVGGAFFLHFSVHALKRNTITIGIFLDDDS